MSLQTQHFSPQLILKTLSVGLCGGLIPRPPTQKPGALPTEPTGRRLTSFAFPTLGNLTRNLGPRVGKFAFLRWEMGPSHIVPCACLCAGHLGSACVEIESIIFKVDLYLLQIISIL